MWLYPNVIQPLFNEFRPLQDRLLFSNTRGEKEMFDSQQQDESLKQKIEDLAAEAKT